MDTAQMNAAQMNAVHVDAQHVDGQHADAYPQALRRQRAARGDRSAAPTATAPRARHRVPLTWALKLYAPLRARALAREDSVACQARELSKLVRSARDTRFGRDHGFGSIRSVADYQARVPLRSYDQLWNEYWREPFPHLVDCTWPGKMPFFAVSSGTSSGKVKHIPCSMQMVLANRRAALEIFVHHIRNRPDSRVWDGKCFALGGSTAFHELAPGVRAGDISGIAAAVQPWWTRWGYFPPRDLTFLTDWEEKIGRLAPRALSEDIRFISGAPGWLALMFEKMASLRPDTPGRLVDLFPDLEVLVHGGVSFAPYRRRFDALLEGSRAELREVYPASEGFVAIADRGPGEGMRMIADNGMFYEFVPVDELGSAEPTRHWLGTVETGVDYAIALTTCAGLWSYVIGDVVRFVDTAPPRLVITGRTAYMLSSFGEHLTGELVETAVLRAAEETSVEVTEFAVGTHFCETPGALGHHVYVAEAAGEMPEPARVQAMARAVDRILQAANEDYEERRAVVAGVEAPRMHVAPAGSFAAWMKRRGKLGGQNKVPRVINDAALFDDLLDFVGGRG
jgi:hypothetical protein